jgi:hypothetical protein
MDLLAFWLQNGAGVGFKVNSQSLPGFGHSLLLNAWRGTRRARVAADPPHVKLFEELFWGARIRAACARVAWFCWPLALDSIDHNIKGLTHPRQIDTAAI